MESHQKRSSNNDQKKAKCSTFFDLFEQHKNEFEKFEINNNNVNPKSVHHRINKIENFLNFCKDHDLLDQSITKAFDKALMHDIENNTQRGKLVTKHTSQALRKLSSYLKRYNLISDFYNQEVKDNIHFKNENKSKNIIVPEEDDIKDILDLIKNGTNKNKEVIFNEEEYIFYRLLIESSLRITHAREFLKWLKSNKDNLRKYIIETEKTILFKFNYSTKNKRCNCVVLTKNTYNDIRNNLKSLLDYNFSKTSEKLSRRDKLTLKYTRKFANQYLMENDVKESTRKFILGHSKDINQQHYTNNFKIALSEYDQKITDKILMLEGLKGLKKGIDEDLLEDIRNTEMILNKQNKADRVLMRYYVNSKEIKKEFRLYEEDIIEAFNLDFKLKKGLDDPESIRSHLENKKELSKGMIDDLCEISSLSFRGHDDKAEYLKGIFNDNYDINYESYDSQRYLNENNLSMDEIEFIDDVKRKESIFFGKGLGKIIKEMKKLDHFHSEFFFKIIEYFYK